MVFFTCDSCGESLKKNKVDKHLMQCQSRSISCVDCGRDFTYDYNSHNQCVSEDQKYGGLDYKPKENSSKGRTKQEEWVQKVKTAINESNCNNHIKDLLQRLSAYDNIPRKKPKFINFVRSCLHINNEYYIQQMWDFFDNIIKSNSDNTQTNNNNNVDKNQTTNGIKRGTDDQDSISKPKKQKSTKNEIINEDIDGNENCNQTNSSQEVVKEEETEGLYVSDNTITVSINKLKIRKIVVQILRESESNSLSLKKLKKRVIKKMRSIDESLTKEDIVSKLSAKLNKIKKISISDGRVSLKQE